MPASLRRSPAVRRWSFRSPAATGTWPIAELDNPLPAEAGNAARRTGGSECGALGPEPGRGGGGGSGRGWSAGGGGRRTADEGEHLTIWSLLQDGSRQRRWHEYYDWGGFTDSTCRPGENGEEQHAEPSNAATWRIDDSLTGLPNRTHLLGGLRTSISRARRTGRLIAVCMLDLDHIKLVNDTLGHLAGDLLLIAVAQRLSDAVRPGDTVARIGSDEFAVVCDEVEDEGEALQLAEDLRAILAHPIHLHGREVRVTASAGVALARDGQPTADALLRNADTALSAAKSGGRDRSAMFDTSLHERAMQRLETERALVRALAGKAIEARFQPIVSSTNGSIVGVEALARLRDPELGLIPPEAFIGVAEDRGLAAEIDCAMLAAACELAARLSDAPGSPWVAFNASSQLVEDPDLVAKVLAACARSSIEPGRLCLEVTERALMHATGGTREALALLRAAGVAIAIDDFGTGYASLTYLREFPATSLKIDRAFVAGVSTDRSDAAIVQAVVSLAHGLGMAVTAEGVEHVAQIELLRSLHCDHLQGFEFGAAMTADELLDLVLARQRLHAA